MGDWLTDLERLRELRISGHISEAEFAFAKDRVLDRYGSAALARVADPPTDIRVPQESAWSTQQPAAPDPAPTEQAEWLGDLAPVSHAWLTWTLSAMALLAVTIVGVSVAGDDAPLSPADVRGTTSSAPAPSRLTLIEAVVPTPPIRRTARLTCAVAGANQPVAMCFIGGGGLGVHGRLAIRNGTSTRVYNNVDLQYEFASYRKDIDLGSDYALVAQANGGGDLTLRLQVLENGVAVLTREAAASSVIAISSDD